MHVLPRVAELHARFERELVVVGVHAGKYVAERRTDKIRSACARLGVTHPVVNDRQFRIWRSFAVEAWPTVVLVGPDGRIVGQQAGEFDLEEMTAAVRHVVEAYGDEIDLSPRDFGTDPAALPEPAGALRFPGRVLLDGERLFVSDTGHDRVLELALTISGPTSASARIVRSFGSGVPALRDGTPEESAFRSPQGLTLLDGDLYVADRSNHAVRRIDLDSGAVTTVAGTGSIGRGRSIGGRALMEDLRSPWDLVPAGDGALLIAMAGAHQLWRLDLTAGRIAPYAGAGGEDILDGPAATALLAQPMGLALADGEIAFCDAESSSVRLLDQGEAPRVRTLAGTGLFDMGDRDGAGDQALLQHAEALAWDGGRLIVADTYNDKLKTIDPVTRDCRAFPGDAGSGAGFGHPAGVAADGRLLLVVSTDEHQIALVDRDTGSISTLEID